MKQLLLFLTFLLPVMVPAQLRPGFDKQEYLELMRVSVRTVDDSAYSAKYEAPRYFEEIYSSPVLGLDNLWDLWVDKKRGIAAISIRGTTQNEASWLANFYAAMVPARGSLHLNDSFQFNYHLADHPQAAVHVGWLVSTAYLSRDILPKIDSLHRMGITQFLIMGHSQGGAVSYLLTSHLYHLQKAGNLPSDIRFKTYCSAGPKPGNLFYAYDYEALTFNGWGFNVVNAADWVPEVPISIQTLNDFNPTNPFVHAKSIIDGQKLPQRIVMKRIYKQLDEPTREAQRNYQKYLGNLASEIVKKTLPGYQAPEYYNSNHYVRTGTTIVLKPDADYYQKYPDNVDHFFVHHFHAPYMLLTEQLPEENSPQHPLDGAWELDFITGPRIAFEGLYPNRKPYMLIQTSLAKVSGNTSCNSFAGGFSLKGGQLHFDENMAMTKMACLDGMGEQTFLDFLQKINSYVLLNNNTLAFYADDVMVMRFRRF